jgi:hypothetical protein
MFDTMRVLTAIDKVMAELSPAMTIVYTSARQSNFAKATA